jgi:glutathione S-transferase
MVGNNVTIADIDLCCMLSPLFKFVFVEKQRKSNFPSVTKWFEHLTS